MGSSVGDTDLFPLFPIFLQQVPHGLFNQLIDPPIFIHGEVGQFPHEPLVQS